MGLFRNRKQVIEDNNSGSEEIRVCPKCWKEKPMSAFYYKKKSLGWVKKQPYCIDCWTELQDTIYWTVHGTD